jgi:hypothetical protein
MVLIRSSLMPRKKLCPILCGQPDDDVDECGFDPPGAPAKLGIMTNLRREVQEIFRQWKCRDDSGEGLRHLLAEVESFSSQRFRVARALTTCRKELHHGGWLPLVNAVAVALDVDEGTVRRWVRRYGTPALVPAAPPPDQGIDHLEAAKKLEVARGTHQGLLAGLTQEEATKQAEEQAPLHEPPPPPPRDPPLTQEEKRHWNFHCAVVKFLEETPQNRKTEEIRVTLGQEMSALLGDRAVPFTVVPLEPTFDLAGRRRQPKPGPVHMTALSDSEIAAFKQFVQALER